MSIKPVEGIACTAIYKFCPEGQYWGSINGECPDCHECKLAKIGCPNKASPIKGPYVQNECPTWTCPAPICTKILKLCPEGQYWGSINDECPDCHPCLQLATTRCPPGTRLVKNPVVQNECPTFTCKRLYTVDPIGPITILPAVE